MILTLVCHTNTATKKDAQGKPLEAQVVLRPVVNEEATNREWSPNAVPSGELKLRVTSPAMIGKLREGQRLEVEIRWPVSTPPSSEPPAAS